MYIHTPGHHRCSRTFVTPKRNPPPSAITPFHSPFPPSPKQTLICCLSDMNAVIEVLQASLPGVFFFSVKNICV